MGHFWLRNSWIGENEEDGGGEAKRPVDSFCLTLISLSAHHKLSTADTRKSSLRRWRKID